MPEHTSWFSYLLALPNFRALWAMFNHLGCVSDADALAPARAMDAGAVCPSGFHPSELPNGFSYPANTPVTLEPFTLALFVAALIVVFVSITRARVLKKEEALVPEGSLTVASFTENFVEVFYGMLRDVLGKEDAPHFLPIIGTCALLIFFSNALGMIPGFSPPTSNFNLTFGCGLVVFFATHIYGFQRQGVAYLKHFVGPVPLLAPLMLPLEIVSHLVRPLALGIRLCVNLFVDHLMVTVFTGLFFLFVPLPIMILGVLVIVLQTYVFCLLATIYIQMAIEHHDDHGADHGHGHDAHGHAHPHSEDAPTTA